MTGEKKSIQFDIQVESTETSIETNQDIYNSIELFELSEVELDKPETKVYNISLNVVEGWNYTIKGEVDGETASNSFTCDEEIFDYNKIMCVEDKVGQVSTSEYNSSIYIAVYDVDSLSVVQNNSLHICKTRIDYDFGFCD